MEQNEQDLQITGTQENAAAEPPQEAEPAENGEKAGTGELSEQKEEKEPYTLKRFVNDALDMAEAFITAIFVVILCFAYLFCTADVDGTSMLETLHDKDRLVVSRLCRLSNNYHTGDILILNSRKAWTYNAAGELVSAPGLDKEIVKRLIATAGQEVNIDFSTATVYVDGKALDEPYINSPTNRDNGAFTYPVTVPEGYIFVLGDNRGVSRDSRDPAVGFVPVQDIVGKVVLRVLPTADFGKVK